MKDDELSVLRARDFWGAMVLLGVSLFFLWRTSFIPLFGTNTATVSASRWYNSAAIVPLGIFGALLILSLVMLVIAIRAGGAKTALSAVGLGWNGAEATRFATLALILISYVAGLVPRVDFILSSGLVITALIYGYHGGHARRMWGAAAVVSLCGLYAFVRHPGQAGWGAWDDDSLTCAVWGLLTLWVIWQGRGNKVLRAVPFIAVLAPLILVCAMAFGFRQNVPNRGGLVFSQIEYHYYVTLRPLWRN